MTRFVCCRERLIGVVSAIAFGATFFSNQAFAGEDWAKNNRHILLSATNLQQNYREVDLLGKTTDGTLNWETGNVLGHALQARWQGQIMPTRLDFSVWLQASTEVTQGSTQYDGYLQFSNNPLRPYSAPTTNTWRNQELAVGVPVVFGLGQVENVQVIPTWQWANRYWQRDLRQYIENYHHASSGPGVVMQWKWRPDVMLEAGGAWLRQRAVRVDVPKLNFSAEQPGGTENKMYLAVTWQPSGISDALKAWQITAKVQSSRFDNGQSPLNSGYVAPPNQHRQNQFGIGLGWRY